MSWFRRNPVPAKVSLTEIQNRVRGFLFDASPEDPAELSSMMGLSELSDDVLEMEEEESARRMARIVGLIPIVYACAHILSEALVTWQMAQFPEEMLDLLPDDAAAKSSAYFEKIAFTSSMGILSQLVDLGLVTLPKSSR